MFGGGVMTHPTKHRVISAYVPGLSRSSLEWTGVSDQVLDSKTSSKPLGTVATFWCVAIDGRPNLKNDIDSLCQSGAVDCGPIQPGGNCYQPNTDDFHASYLFNAYYQAHKTCNFNGDSMLEQNLDLSTPTCKFVR
ncbi:hypothetical protein LUZ61_003981 [Rhynchospora tenuis]|uniref:X8 domain-containing protein n=1 Tax=Rhynchospora tenuis TaxID=198213 RepID=A0AAD5ZLS6_9POAL|nr:hypothetical protein LUZ61_003981 [Rhynchospora tenuis]